MGSATAWHLARRGRSVALLERFEQGHVRGSSHGGSRIFRLAYDDPQYVHLARAALAGWRELEEDAGEDLLDLTGGVDHGEAAAVDRVAAALTGSGAAFEVLAPGAAAERWPGLRFDGQVLFSPEGGRCRSDATVAALQRRVAQLGGCRPHRTVERRPLVEREPVQRNGSALAVVPVAAELRVVLDPEQPRPELCPRPTRAPQLIRPSVIVGGNAA